jgi:hypothetical protein
MKTKLNILFVAALAWVAASGCAPSLEQREINAASTIEAIRDGQFEDAESRAMEVLDDDPGNPFAGIVAAISLYKRTMHNLFVDGQTVIIGAVATGNMNQRYLGESLDRAAKDLSRVNELLDAAADEPRVSLEICLACWEVDWNHNGAIDEFDEHLMEVEQDAYEREYKRGDPRRRPTFRFDHGDVLWASAFISFQRAAVDLIRAFDWSELGNMFRGGIFSSRGEPPERMRFEMTSPELVESARQQILEGLDLSDAAREAYLKETDDDREWLPNPRQKDHPLPLPVDTALYDIWEAVVDDVRRIVRGEEGLSVAELAQLGDHQWERPPRGYLDIGKMLSEPRDIVLEIKTLDEIDDYSSKKSRRQVERVLEVIFGDYYVRRIAPSPLLRRAKRMKREVEAGKESIDRKLRYLFWIN